VPYPQAAEKHQDANAEAAAALGAAVIVAQHPPEEPTLERTVWRLLGPRLRGAAPEAFRTVVGGGDPLGSLRSGMEQLAVRDADRRLADLLVALAQGEDTRR